MTFNHRGIAVRRHDVPFASFYWSDDRTGFVGEASSEQEARDGIDMQILARGDYGGWRISRVHGGDYEALKAGAPRLGAGHASRLLDMIDMMGEPVAA